MGTDCKRSVLFLMLEYKDVVMLVSFISFSVFISPAEKY